MQIKTPGGVVVSVSDAKAERLLKAGYSKLGEVKPEPEQEAPKRRGRPRKTD